MSINFDQVVADIEEIVAEKGSDYVYTDDPKTAATARYDRTYAPTVEGAETPPCYYRQHDGTPGCIVGQFIAKYDPDFSVPEGSTAITALDHAGLQLSYQAGQFLLNLQRQQDAGVSWGEALEQAKVISGKFTY